MSSLTPAATRLMLVQRRDTVAPKRAEDGKVRRYRLARMSLNPGPRRAGDRFAHLRRSYD